MSTVPVGIIMLGVPVHNDSDAYEVDFDSVLPLWKLKHLLLSMSHLLDRHRDGQNIA